jgi:hypothetical protein
MIHNHARAAGKWSAALEQMTEQWRAGRETMLVFENFSPLPRPGVCECSEPDRKPFSIICQRCKNPLPMIKTKDPA